MYEWHLCGMLCQSYIFGYSMFWWMWCNKGVGHHWYGLRMKTERMQLFLRTLWRIAISSSSMIGSAATVSVWKSIVVMRVGVLAMGLPTWACGWLQSPVSPGAASPGGGSVSPATGGLSPASGSPVGATVPPRDHAPLYDAQVGHLTIHRPKHPDTLRMSDRVDV